MMENTEMKNDSTVKLPPLEKVFEAWTALASRRVKMADGEAEVASSDGQKVYKVRFDGDRFASTDNATFWQGYAGYPVLAVLMLQGRLPYDREEAELWKDVNWTLLNKRFRNRYALAVEEVARERGIDEETARLKATQVLDALRRLPLQIKRKL